ncbi:hypothetical protein AgCh_040363 [Apium graveolens]
MNKNKKRKFWKDVWREIEVELKFKVHESLCPTIVKGLPYWLMKHNRDDEQFAIVSFNMQSEKFSKISLPDGMCHKLPSEFSIFEYEESLAVAARPLDQDISIWTPDDYGCWIKKFTITNPKLRCIFGCLKTGEFVGHILRELVLYDPVNKVAKPTQLSMRRLKIYNYSESLANIAIEAQLKIEKKINDYKVVRIVTNTSSFVNRVQLYSLNKNKISWKNGWKEIKVELKFRVCKFTDDHEYLLPEIVKGSVYWRIKQNPADQQFAMVLFDMQSEKFGTISLPDSICHYKFPSKFNIF